MFYITLLSEELSLEKYSETVKTEIILLIVYQSDLLPETQTACYAQMVSTIYDIEEIYSKGRRKVQVYAKNLLCCWAVRELGKSININRYSKLFTYLWMSRTVLWFSNLVVESLVYFQRKIA